uniref:Ubiquitin carboxyl-terminal hydrolase n=1 Tax=Phallusia mammillata TaxID=59560 RepID=A0A6F9DX49_9ASCI|nr:ubiquitin carboxyl-terminal hydrolase 16-like [Phallusia mammillata]
MVKKRVKQRRSNAKQNQRNSNRTSPNVVKSVNSVEKEETLSEDDTKSEQCVETTLSATEEAQLPQPIGLQNLGNTCFFNSVMQNLWQTPSLHALLKHHKKLFDERATCTIVPNDESIPPLTYIPAVLGPTTLALLTFMEAAVSLRTIPPQNNQRRQVQRARVVSPKALFNQICNKNARFQGYQQQDSQELLHSLLGAIKLEDSKRKKLGILRALNLERAKAKDVPEETKATIKAYGIEVSENEPSIVDAVFGGTLLSSVLCDECGTVTGVKEPFCDISLPIIDDKRTFKPHHKTNGAKNTKKPMNGKGDNQASTETVDNTSTPLSKHARKKAKREAKKQSRQNFRSKQELFDEKLTEDNSPKSIDSLAKTIADDAICSALAALSISKDTEQLEQVSDKDENKRVKGGAINLITVELPGVEGTVNDAAKPESTVNSLQASCSEGSTCSDDKNTTEKDSSSEVEPYGEVAKTPVNKMNKKLTPESLFDTPLAHQPVKQKLSFCKDLPQSLGTRYQPKDQECSVQSCLHQFTMAEMLTGSNMFGCENCTKNQNPPGKQKVVYCSASKQMLIHTPPPVLIIHLKRFHQVGFNLRKVNKHVDIPILLDLAPFCTTDCKEFADEDSRILYHLYGIVEHAGSLSRGHYTAYVKVRSANDRLSALLINQQKCVPEYQEGAKSISPSAGVWYHISDTTVSKSSQAKALSSNAYLLFYERIL